MDIVIRPAMKDLEGALDQARHLRSKGLEFDGVIARSKTSMVQYKIKERHTLDAVYKGGMFFVSDHDRSLCGTDKPLIEGDVYELEVYSNKESGGDMQNMMEAGCTLFSISKHRPEKKNANPRRLYTDIVSMINHGGFDVSLKMYQQVCTQSSKCIQRRSEVWHWKGADVAIPHDKRVEAR